MISIADYIREFADFFPDQKQQLPWHLTRDIESVIRAAKLSSKHEYNISGTILKHRSAVVEEGVVLKGAIIISEGVFIGAHAYLRGGVFLGPRVSIGPGCEIKSSLIMQNSQVAHFNFIGDSIVGSNVNFEAGSVVANHHNDRDDKTIFVRHGDELVRTDATKFGALIGDRCKIGANAVLSPGTALLPDTIVKRLELIQQA